MDASASQTFGETFGGLQDDGFNWVINTTDGGYAMTGYTGSYGNASLVNSSNSTSGQSGVWLFKVDASGKEQWNRTYGGLNQDVGYSLVQTPDKGYAIAGYTTASGWMEMYLIRTDANGIELWNRTFTNGDQDGAYSLAMTSDGGFILTGFSYMENKSGWDLYLVKTDANGYQQWNKTIGGLYKDAGHDVEQTSDGGYIITGYTQSYGNRGGGTFGQGTEDLWLLKTDAHGNEEWNQTFGGKNYDDGFAVHELSDGGYIVAGTTKSILANGTKISAFSPNDTARVYLIKTDAEGKELWNQTYGGNTSSAAFDMIPVTGGYVLTGATYTTNGDADIFALKTNLTGTVEWAKSYGGPKNDFAYSIIPATDGGYILAGQTESFGRVAFDGYLLKIGDDGSGPTLATSMPVTATSQGVPLVVYILSVIVIVCLAGALFFAWGWYTHR